ncbi:MAG: DUF3649 domain-containing protein [Candidatus Accumulibacter sp.]|jgi:hypothetical protein|nr:DUF3649 domain-containing protein [Accumulibacter sp.]
MKKTFSRLLAPLERHPRLNPGLRILLAVFGGYGAAWLGAAALASGLPLPRSDAVTLAVILAFVLQLLLILWVFATATLIRAALGVLLPALLFGAWLQWNTAGAAPGSAARDAVETSVAAGFPPANQRDGREGRPAGDSGH